MRTQSQAYADSASSPGIDLAPMLDFVVNLLIFFIVTAVFVKQSAIDLQRPRATTGPGTTAKSVVIDENGDVSIDNDIIDLRAVRAHIEVYRAENPDVGIVIVAHEHAPTGAVVAVADQIKLAGIDEIRFSTSQ